MILTTKEFLTKVASVKLGKSCKIKNINRRKRLGISRSKSKSKISDKAYANMQAGFPNSKKNKLKIKANT